MILALRQGEYKVNLEQLVPENKEIPKDHGNTAKKNRHWFEGTATGQIIWEIKINNDSNDL